MKGRRFALLAVSLLITGSGTWAVAGNGLPGPTVIRPNYYQGVGKTLNAIDRQQVTIYRDQLDVQRRALQLRLYQGSIQPRISPSPLGLPANPAFLSRDLFQTQSELDMVNALLHAAPTAPIGALTPPAQLRH